jgi:hypothetical protein
MGCGSSSSASSSNATNPYAAVYKQVKWGSTATVTFPSSCTMTYTTTGLPDYTPNAYYLGPPTTQYPTVVAETPISHLQLAVIPWSPSAITGTTVTLNTCPTKAATATTTNMGAIGYMISGVDMFNAYEATGTPALSDNVSYTFADSSGAQVTAYFLDQCNGHTTPLNAGYTFHYHGNPDCVTSQVDTASGPSHIIGIALDGYPIYGGRDINGDVIPVSDLDTCNGITSATPEFPNGAYHYVLPIGVTGAQSSIGCYSGTVTEEQMVAARKVACKMTRMKMTASNSAIKKEVMRGM